MADNNLGCLGGFAIFALIAVVWQSQQPKKPESSFQEDPKYAEVLKRAAIERSVKAILRDPDSAKFVHTSANCGYVNSKNGFGGYAGMTRFIANPNADAALETAGNTRKFSRLWNQHCIDK